MGLEAHPARFKAPGVEGQGSMSDPLQRALDIAISIETAVELDRTVYLEDVRALLRAIEEAISTSRSVGNIGGTVPPAAKKP